MISFLWLIKDNCCSANTLHAFLPESNHAIERKTGHLHSNCQGIYHVPLVFTKKEINEAIEIYARAAPLFYHNNLKVSTSDEPQPDMILERSITPHDFKKVSRIERAFNFLELARVTNQLPQKIAFYMCIYETLFYGNNSGEIVHQIAERVALYISKPRFKRHGIYKLIKDAYKVRSIYFHGNSFKNYKTDLAALSTWIDNLTRDVLRKVKSTC